MALFYYPTVFVFIFIFQHLKQVTADCSNSTVSITTVCGTNAPTGVICSGDLIFEDNFDKLCFKTWRHDATLSGNVHVPFQFYSNNRTLSFVKNGVMHLAPGITADEIGEAALSTGTIDLNSWYPNSVCTNNLNNGCRKVGAVGNILNPIKCPRLNTMSSFSFKYGRVQVYAKLPAGDWLWPAFWMLPTYNQYSTWPASGEIDIFESRGNTQFIQNGVNIGNQRMSSTLHWGPNSKNNKYSLTSFNTQRTASWSDTFHLYELYWTPDYIQFLVDGNQTGMVTPTNGGFWEMGNFNNSGMANPWAGASKMAPFDQEFYLIMNLACGGNTFFSDSANNTLYPKPWKNTDGTLAMTNFWNAKNLWYPTWNSASYDSHLQIDYIRVYAL